jgi:hypothetical protein
MDNVVVCCRTINTLLADLSPKRKLELVLAWKGKISCPEINQKQKINNKIK